MSPVLVTFLVLGALGGVYALTRSSPPTAPNKTPGALPSGSASLSSGQWYRVRGNIDLAWEDKVRSASGSAAQKVLEAQLRGDLTSSGAFDDVRFAAQDPSKPGLWIFIARAARNGSLPALEHVSLASAEEVEPPPAVRESTSVSYDPPQSLDAGMIEQDAKALAYGLATDDDPKHLFALAEAYGSDYPIAAGLFLLKGALIAQAKTRPASVSSAPVSTSVPSTSNMLRRLQNAGVTQAAKRFAGGTALNFGSVFDVVSDAAGTGEKLIKEAKDQLPEPARDAVDRAEDAFNAVVGDRLKGFAESEAGKTFFRAVATGGYFALVPFLGPQLASVAFAFPGLIRGEPFDQAYLTELMWRMETTAKILGADIQQKFSEELSRVLTLLHRDIDAGHPEVTKLPIAELSKRYALPGATPVREDVIAYAVALLRRSLEWLQNLGDFDPKTGKQITAKDRTLQSIEQVAPKPAFVKKYLQLLRASQMTQARVPKLVAPVAVQQAVSELGPSVVQAFARYLPIFAQLPEAASEAPRSAVEDVMARLAGFRREDVDRVRGLVWDMLKDKSLRTIPITEAAARLKAPTPLVETAREMIRELPGGLGIVDAERMRRVLPEGPKPVSASALLLLDAATRPGRSGVDDTSAAKTRVLQIAEGAKRGDADAMRAAEELRRAQQAVNRQKWVESLARIEQGRG